MDKKNDLKLGKGTAFVKARLKRLRQEDDTWEADFRALPKPITQSETHYLGLVVAQPDGSLLADSHVEGRSSVNDLATLLAHAMRRPLTGKAYRPRRIHVRGHHHRSADFCRREQARCNPVTHFSKVVVDLLEAHS